jgi:peroxiredoxin
MPGVGDRIPDAEVMRLTEEGPQRVPIGEVLGKGKAVLIAVPGAFTPTCTEYHLPGFVLHAAEIRERGVDVIACLSVNDPFVMGAWAREQGVADDIVMLSDPDARFTKAMGMEVDAGEFGLGIRSQRYAAVLEDGVLVHLDVEEHFADHILSTADAVLGRL